MIRIGRWLPVAMGLALTGCGLLGDQLSSGKTTIRGVPPDLELMSDPVLSAQAENKLIEALTIRAGLDHRVARSPSDWPLIFRAGVRVVDGQCDQYLDALFRFNREQRAGRQGLAAVAAATGSIMGLAGVGATAIAITAAAFGLSTSLFDASVGSVLFTIEPSALRNVVLQGRRNYLDALIEKKVVIASRPDAMIALQGYLTQCSPAAIEANINNAANGSRNAVTSSDKRDAQNAAVSAAPGVLLTREQRAQDIVGRRVDPRPQPLPPPPDDILLPGEEGILPRDISAAQRTLGVPVTGRIGPEGSETRRAIAEFERGMRARNEPGWTDATGKLAGLTGDTLTALGSPMPAGLQSPFERAFLTNMTRTTDGAPRLTAIDPRRLALVWLALFPTEAPPATVPQMLPRIRAGILAERANRSLSPGKSSLDSELWNAIKPRT